MPDSPEDQPQILILRTLQRSKDLLVTCNPTIHVARTLLNQATRQTKAHPHRLLRLQMRKRAAALVQHQDLRSGNQLVVQRSHSSMVDREQVPMKLVVRLADLAPQVDLHLHLHRPGISIQHLLPLPRIMLLGRDSHKATIAESRWALLGVHRLSITMQISRLVSLDRHSRPIIPEQLP